MSQDSKSSPVAVRVCIDEWLDGKYGRYAPARVVSPDPPSPEAQYSVKKLKVQPELGVSFDCSIQFVESRWRVVALAEDAKPIETEMAGYVESVSGNGAKRSWRIKLTQMASPSAHATLNVKTLNAAKFAHLESGQDLTFMALPAGDDAWEVTRILTPTLADTITDTESAYTLFALRDWNSEASAKSVLFAVGTPSSKIWPQVWVLCNLLQRQSISVVTHCTLETRPDLQLAGNQIADAQEVLREGSPEDIANLEVSFLSVSLVWNAQGYWNVQRLLAPLAMREPADKEVIEWIEGTVVSVEPLKAKPSAVEEADHGDEDSEALMDEPMLDDNAAPPPSTPGKNKSMKVTLAIKDRRIGRGNVNGFLKATEVVNGGLAEGAKVTVRLVGKPPFWNISRLHRSLPQRGEV